MASEVKLVSKQLVSRPALHAQRGRVCRNLTVGAAQGVGFVGAVGGVRSRMERALVPVAGAARGGAGRGPPSAERASGAKGLRVATRGCGGEGAFAIALD